MIVPAASHLPLKVTANTGNVALRVPASEIPLAVVRAAKIPITATSANLSGATECTTAEQVQEQLQGRISLIVDGGKSPRTVSSTIVHFREDGTWQILREGAIPAKDKEVLQHCIKALMARQIWRTEGYYEVSNAYDPVVKKALETFTK